MSKLNRRGSSDRLGEWVEFSFSCFRAVQVPVVSDRLILSIVAVDTRKTIAKSTKAAARNGICQWPDSVLEPIWFSQDEDSEEFQECQCRFVVSMGSTKNGILGEVLLNLTNYVSSLDSTAISLPLKRCNSGTVLQDPSFSRVHVKVLYQDSVEVPRSITLKIARSWDGEERLWTFPVYLLHSEMADVLPADEAALPPDNANPHPFVGHVQPGEATWVQQWLDDQMEGLPPHDDQEQQLPAQNEPNPLFQNWALYVPLLQFSKFNTLLRSFVVLMQI
ncbi:hypothetical protein GUJ93_ZPchr0010g9288 [Zizania palustris]|uniref:C2 NT-type domain-containing protein n=1 Tax=Zizania palustris TaxID=103762 RepID=A0A8J5TBL0_ZIZPA|nr:hypothetical protein GUJ93_ZPchr0010g9288 [Zizania palustris]